jgi:nuclear polyadenylated RNA-binding protein NAB2
MAVEVVAESPLAKALQEVVGPKLVDLGWSTGMQDETLSEYIILMLANGKSQEQIASELSNDLLDLGPEDQGAIDFSRWLFEQVDVLNAKLNGPSASNGSIPTTEKVGEMSAFSQGPASVNDAEMGDASAPGSANMYVYPTTWKSFENIDLTCFSPTGPKAMRNGSLKSGRGGRMLGQINKTLNQPQDALHRVRAGAGSGRINSHSSREPPKGPRAQQIQRGLAMAQQRPMANMQMPGMPMTPQMQQPGMMMTPQDQMHFMATLAETAQQMAFQMQQMGQQMNIPPNGSFSAGRPHRGGSHLQGRQPHNGNRVQSVSSQDTTMGEAGHPSGEHKDAPMGGQPQEPRESRDLSRIPCKFDISCTKPDCPFAHHSPEARPGTVLPEIDMENECSFGVRCANKHCNGRHASKAKRAVFQAEKDCLYGPWCKNPSCSFKHPVTGTKECRNGGDCTIEGCAFWHNKVECKHNPCKNVLCRYKHKEGQKLGAFGDHVWTPNGEKKPHISERKFVDENAGPEEFVGPGVDPEKMTDEPNAAAGIQNEDTSMDA